jgi:hypothetical protein
MELEQVLGAGGQRDQRGPQRLRRGVEEGAGNLRGHVSDPGLDVSLLGSALQEDASCGFAQCAAMFGVGIPYGVNGNGCTTAGVAVGCEVKESAASYGPCTSAAMSGTVHVVPDTMQDWQFV